MSPIPEPGPAGQPATASLHNPPPPPAPPMEFDPSGLIAEAEQACPPAPPTGNAVPPAGEAPPAPETVSAEPGLSGNATLPWPPGRTGVIARHLYARSYSPIPEVAITAALGLLAGVCGRAYRTHTDKDLALYIILVAKSGVGKEAIHEGIPMMLEAAEQTWASDFCRAQDFASGEALHKGLLREPGFLYLQGEFGRKLKRMGNPTDSLMQYFRTVMTQAFAKNFLEGKEYSNPENSLGGVHFPALSFLGETTPGTFLECLTEDMMADGFLSRFLVVSYLGDRPSPNRQRDQHLPPEELRAWRDLVAHAVQFKMPINAPTALVAKPTPEAEAMLDAFEAACIESLNHTDEESERQVWTRAHLKALKVAGLLAVADHYLFPTVRPQHVQWALALVHRDIEVFQQRKRNGDIGTGDDARERKLVEIIRKYIQEPTISASYSVPAKMHKDGLVPRHYLQRRVQTLAAFTNHKLGVSRALTEALGNMVADGWLMECKKTAMVDVYGHHGVTFRVLDLPK